MRPGPGVNRSTVRARRWSWLGDVWEPASLPPPMVPETPAIYSGGMASPNPAAGGGQGMRLTCRIQLWQRRPAADSSGPRVLIYRYLARRTDRGTLSRRCGLAPRRSRVPGACIPRDLNPQVSEGRGRLRKYLSSPVNWFSRLTVSVSVGADRWIRWITIRCVALLALLADTVSSSAAPDSGRARRRARPGTSPGSDRSRGERRGPAPAALDQDPGVGPGAAHRRLIERAQDKDRPGHAIKARPARPGRRSTSAHQWKWPSSSDDPNIVIVGIT
jgi:hypothetical protein